MLRGRPGVHLCMKLMLSLIGKILYESCFQNKFCNKMFSCATSEPRTSKKWRNYFFFERFAPCNNNNLRLIFCFVHIKLK